MSDLIHEFVEGMQSIDHGNVPQLGRVGGTGDLESLPAGKDQLLTLHIEELHCLFNISGYDAGKGTVSA